MVLEVLVSEGIRCTLLACDAIFGASSTSRRVVAVLLHILPPASENEEEELVRINESKVSEEDAALKEMTTQATHEAQELARAQTLEKQEQLCELSRALSVLA